MSNLNAWIVIFANAKKMENSTNNDAIIWLICQQISWATYNNTKGQK